MRIIQGSCRKPHGESTDALEILDDLIAVDNNNPTTRPHLLLLGGDQIYADDVADDLLTAISDTAKKLMGYEETVMDGGTANPVGGTTLPGGTARSAVVKAAGSTSDDVKTQLMSLGEYITMYLYAWSDVLWPTSPLTGGGQAVHVEHYRTALPKVRRARANIPSYMIFDDHEVIDDFNMSARVNANIPG